MGKRFNLILLCNIIKFPQLPGKLLPFQRLCFMHVLMVLAFFLSCSRSIKKERYQLNWSAEVVSLKDSLQQYHSDFEKTTFLRKYCASLMAVGIPDARVRSIYQDITFESFQLDRFYKLFRNEDIPSECGVTSYFYIKLAQSLGYKAYQYSFGFADSPYTAFIHSFPIVAIQYNGKKRMIVQDPYLDMTFVDSTKAPIDFYLFLSLIKAKEYNQIFYDTVTSLTSLIITDTLLYLSPLNDSCRSVLRSRIYGDKGRVKNRIPFIRSYNNLMRSPCENFESGFVHALFNHHIHEPFIYAYSLRVNEMAGSADVKRIQSHIDSLLRDTVVNKLF